MPCPREGADCTKQDKLELRSGWFNKDANASGLTANGTATFNVSLTVASTLESTDTSAIDLGLRGYFQCEDPICTVVLALEAASVRVHATVTDTAAASVAAAALLTTMSEKEASAALGFDVVGPVAVDRTAMIALGIR